MIPKNHERRGSPRQRVHVGEGKEDGGVPVGAAALEAGFRTEVLPQMESGAGGTRAHGQGVRRGGGRVWIPREKDALNGGSRQGQGRPSVRNDARLLRV
ncbi:hypothetical protein RZS08_04845, partial [Arthrospira platensis SPKY1]|nr:hypothetical protein [Arthrospira platensis SPKY1]